MTPPATAAALPAAPRTSRRAPVRHPRRVSGPAGPRKSGATAAGPRGSSAAPAALPAVPARKPPRRGPERPSHAPRPSRARPDPARAPRTARTPRTARGRTADAPGIALRAIGALDSVSRSTLLDRLIRSRAWIGVLAFLLIGIVGMQLVVLKLNNDVGHLLSRAAALQRQGTVARIEDSQDSSGSLVEPAAAAAGMTVAAPGSLRFVRVEPSDIARAASALERPVEVPETTASAGTPASTEAAGSTGVAGSAGAPVVSTEASASTEASGG